MMPFIVRVGVGCVQTAAVRRPDLNRVLIDEPVFDRIILAYNPDTSTLIGAIRRCYPVFQRERRAVLQKLVLRVNPFANGGRGPASPLAVEGTPSPAPGALSFPV